MYALIGNAILIWFSIGVFNYFDVNIGYKKKTLDDIALHNNVAHISSVSITKRVEPDDGSNPDVRFEQNDVTKPTCLLQKPPMSRLGKWWHGGSNITDSSNCVTGGKSALELSQYLSQYDALKNAIESSTNSVTRAEKISRLSKYVPLYDISGYITDISNCKMLDCIGKTAHQFTNYDTTPFKIPFICKNSVFMRWHQNSLLLRWQKFGYSFFQFIGVTKLIENLSERCMNYIGFKHCEHFDSTGVSIWTYLVPNTEPIVFFPEPGIGFQFVHWGHYLKSLGRTVHIFGITHNERTLVVDKSHYTSPSRKLNNLQVGLFPVIHDILVDSSRAIDAEDYINRIIERKYFLTVSSVNGFEFNNDGRTRVHPG